MLKVHVLDELHHHRSNVAHGVEVPAGARLLFTNGQVGTKPDGSTPQHLNHFAIPVATEEEFNESWQRLKDHGAEVTGIIERGYGKTFYFQDPNGIRLQIELRTRQDDSEPNGDPDPVPSAAKYLA